jgi:pyruvate,orthophosphate dikinase
MHGLPVTIRLLDPPLHEFLPKTDEEIADVAAAMGMEATALRQRVDALHEFNPMLGHRGCRLAISYPEIVEMQARAIFEAAVEAAHETGAAVVPRSWCRWSAFARSSTTSRSESMPSPVR